MNLKTGLWKGKIDKTLAKLIKKKRKKIQINSIKYEKGEVATDATEIQRIIKRLLQATASK